MEIESVTKKIEYRRASTFPQPVNYYPFTVCQNCGEIFYNDTHYPQINCPNDKWVLQNCINEEEAIKISELIKTRNAIRLEARSN